MLCLVPHLTNNGVRVCLTKKALDLPSCLATRRTENGEPPSRSWRRTSQVDGEDNAPPETKWNKWDLARPGREREAALEEEQASERE